MSQIRINHRTYWVKWLTADPRIFGVMLEADGSLSVIPDANTNAGMATLDSERRLDHVRV
jgi:hypothetical protein